MTATRPRPGLVNSRPYPVPSGGTTIHLLGDLHTGDGVVSANARRAKVRADMIDARTLPVPSALVQTGDLVNSGITAEDSTALPYLAAVAGSVPWYAACGNHDIWNNARTPAQWASAFGLPGKNYTADIGGMRLIVVGPDALATGDTTSIVLSSTTINWLDTQLTAAGSTPCIVACHAPLAETVVGDSSLMYGSHNGDFTSPSGTNAFAVNAGSDTGIRAVLAAHNNAKAWVSGHTHSPLSAPGLVTTVTVGSRTMLHLNTSAVAYTGKAYTVEDSAISPYLTYYGDRFEVRWRDHSGVAWRGPSGVRVTTVAST